jgi:chloramphenicol 3-O-phosphotransferase
VPERVLEIESLMIEGMHQVVPGMRVKVETVITRSLHKADLDPRYLTPTEHKEAVHGNRIVAA